MRRLSIERRIALRKHVIPEARQNEGYVLSVTPDELEELLDSYESGGFQTREPRLMGLADLEREGLI